MTYPILLGKQGSTIKLEMKILLMYPNGKTYLHSMNDRFPTAEERWSRQGIPHQKN